MLAPGIGNVGDRVIVYLDHIGRVEGKITRIIDSGFAMSVSATPRKRDKLASQLTWLANRDILNLPEDRRHERIVPRNPIATLTLEDGTRLTCRIIDLSMSGAAVSAEKRPPLQSKVATRQGARPCCPQSGRGLRARVHSRATSRYFGSQRQRPVNAILQNSPFSFENMQSSKIALHLTVLTERTRAVGISVTSAHSSTGPQLK